MRDVYIITGIVDMKLDIEDCLAQVESCFNLLVPRFDIPDIYSSAESQDSSFELSPPHRGTEEVAEEEERKERQRKRTISSTGSFVSLSSGEEESDDDGHNEEEGEAPSSASIPCTDEQKKIDEAVKDEEILRRLYASSTTTSASADGHVVKLGAIVSTSSRKGKEKLKSDLAEEAEGGMHREVDGGAYSSGSDSSSDVEWEDVPMTGSHDQRPAADLQEHGLMSRGFSIPITIELSTTPEVRETEDNASIIATLQECKQLLSEKYLPTINKWMEVGTMNV